MKLTIVLIDPKIPQNTGNIGRMVAAYDCTLHIVGEVGFDLDDKQVRRAGLDYWQYLDWEYFPDTDAYLQRVFAEKRCFLLSSKVEKSYYDVKFQDDDHVIFGSETEGLPKPLLAANPDLCFTIPMPNSNIRSLNLSNCVAMVVAQAYEPRA